MKKYVLDTNLYIRAYRSEQDAAELERFYAAFAPGTYLSSVVLHELMVGASNVSKARQVRDDIARPFLRTRRLLTPSHAAWDQAGEAIARLAWEDGLDRRTLPRSFVNDCLLAASCREAGATLVTDNRKDFDRIRKAMRFDHVSPWPSS